MAARRSATAGMVPARIRRLLLLLLVALASSSSAARTPWTEEVISSPQQEARARGCGECRRRNLQAAPAVPAAWTSPDEGSFAVRPAFSYNAWAVANGANVSLSLYANGYNTTVGGLWNITLVGTSYMFRDKISNMCLDVPPMTSYLGAQVIRSSCAPAARQLWAAVYSQAWNGAVQWQHAASGLCLSAVADRAVLLAACAAPLLAPAAMRAQLWLATRPSAIRVTASPSGLSFPDSAPTSSKLNVFSRHASVVTLTLPSSVNWRPFFANDTNDQSSCGSCSIFAVVGAIEGVFNFVSGSSPPVSLSKQQVLSCNGSCTGTWPERTMEYVISINAGLALTTVYGNYVGTELPCQAAPGTAKVLRYEKLAAYSESAAMAALFRQPLAAYMTMTPNFLQWGSWDIFSDAEQQCTYGSPLNHMITLVGYGVEKNIPFWIVRNSFGPTWGDSGYARIMRNICGISSASMLYPVIATSSSSPCTPINPCGAGVCTTISASAYNCTCPANYVNVVNSDSTRTCAICDVCGTSPINPCGSGSCINHGNGLYHCICFKGYVPSVKSDGNPSCAAPQELTPALPKTYTAAQGDNCYFIAIAFGFTLQQLIAANPRVGRTVCSPLAVGEVLNISSTANYSCKSTYSIQTGDTCASIESDLGLPRGALNASLNPGLACEGSPPPPGLAGGLQPGQQVCIELGQPAPFRICTAVNFVTDADLAPLKKGKRCTTLLTRLLKVKASDFFQINGGINCNSLVTAQDFCTTYSDPPTSCPTYYKWQAGDTCSSVIAKFCGSRTTLTWTQCLGPNAGVCVGTGSTWSPGRIICVTTCISVTGLRVPNCYG